MQSASLTVESVESRTATLGAVQPFAGVFAQLLPVLLDSRQDLLALRDCIEGALGSHKTQ